MMESFNNMCLYPNGWPKNEYVPGNDECNKELVASLISNSKRSFWVCLDQALLVNMLINCASIMLTFILEIIYERSFKTEAVLVTIKHICF